MNCGRFEMNPIDSLSPFGSRMHRSHTLLVCFTVTLAVPIVAGDATFVRTTLQEHFSEARHHVTNPDYKLKTKEFISTEFRNYGLETHEHSFTGENQVAAVNVIGILRGSMFNTSDDRVFGIAAHYDTMRNTSGVDDNGSSMAALLSAAKALSTSQRNYTFMFVAFDLEEWEDDADKACAVLGCGSDAFIRDWIPTYWTTTPDFAGFIVMDTIMNFNETVESQVLPGPFVKLFPEAIRSINSDDRQGGLSGLHHTRLRCFLGSGIPRGIQPVWRCQV
ncbi:uncharacterized protein LOC124266713 [Haliotis rubra]|uniref:uncharacterized protein LOC124266713 n=1 Tax=Haliotis rubra TaxID=36100 RepID=UPI001EE54028|nr:uncharacterized protein LOC124266713 [Haliotis rubra]